MDMSPDLVQRTVVVCVEKHERGIGLQTLLQKVGMRVVITLSLYEALKAISQEMPHLVISEPTMSDGSAVNLFDKLLAHEILCKTPVLVYLQKKSKEDLQAIAVRRFAGFYLGAAEPSSFLQKVSEIISTHASVSPYFVATEDLGLSSDVTVAIEATILGRSGEYVLAKSSAELDPAAALVCVPVDSQLSPVVLHMATNLRHGEDIYNLFPVNRITGAGRKWVLSLPEIKASEDGSAKGMSKSKKILFFDPDEQRLAGFGAVLQGYGFEVVGAKTSAAALASLQQDHLQFDAVYLHEMNNDNMVLEWQNTYNKLPQNRRPPLVVATNVARPSIMPGWRFIKRPFGLGAFIEVLGASCLQANEVSASVNTQQSANILCRYEAEAKLLGLDESGGVLSLGFPLVKGSRLTIKHEFLIAAWDGTPAVQISAAVPRSDSPKICHARFDAVAPGMSKIKYWEKVSKLMRVFGSDGS